MFTVKTLVNALSSRHCMIVCSADPLCNHAGHRSAEYTTLPSKPYTSYCKSTKNITYYKLPPHISVLYNGWTDRGLANVLLPRKFAAPLLSLFELVKHAEIEHYAPKVVSQVEKMRSDQQQPDLLQLHYTFDPHTCKKTSTVLLETSFEMCK